MAWDAPLFKGFCRFFKYRLYFLSSYHWGPCFSLDITMSTTAAFRAQGRQATPSEADGSEYVSDNQDWGNRNKPLSHHSCEDEHTQDFRVSTSSKQLPWFSGRRPSMTPSSASSGDSIENQATQPAQSTQAWHQILSPSVLIGTAWQHLRQGDAFKKGLTNSRAAY